MPRRSLERRQLYSPTSENCLNFAQNYGEKWGIEPVAVSTPLEAATKADILVSPTNSMVPTISQNLVRPGMHITSVRGSEIPAQVLQTLDFLVVNTSEPVSAYAARGKPSQVLEFKNGDYSRPDIGVIDFSRVPELKDVVSGHAREAVFQRMRLRGFTTLKVWAFNGRQWAGYFIERQKDANLIYMLKVIISVRMFIPKTQLFICLDIRGNCLEM